MEQQQCAVSVGRFLYLNSIFFFFLFKRSVYAAPFHQLSYGHIAKMILCIGQTISGRVLTELPAIIRRIECWYLYEEYCDTDGELLPLMHV